MVLYTHDDGSYRQKWILHGDSYLSKYIGVAGGIKNPEKKMLSLDGTGFKLLDPLNAQLGPVYPFAMHLYSIENSVDDYYFQSVPYSTPSFIMAAKNYTSVDLIQQPVPSTFSPIQKWKIVPFEDFEIMDITFDFVSGDKFEFTIGSVQETEHYNDDPTSEHFTRTYTLEKSTQSTFSETHKLTTTVQNNIKIKTGVPVIAEGEISVSETTAEEFSWNRGKTETVKETISETRAFEIPPYSHVKRRVIKYQYNVDITYYAKVRGVQSDVILYLPGRWKGTIVDATKYETITTPLR